MRNLFCYFLCALFSFSVFNSAPTNAQSVLPAEIPVEYDVSPLGAFSYTVPLGIPPGIREMVPNLAVTYNSQSGKGLLGIGWTISGLSMITRTDATIFHNQLLDPVDFDNNDVFALDGQRLVETDNETYMTEVKNFALIQSFGSAGNGPSYFIVEHPDGTVFEYGNSSTSKMLAQGRSDVLMWAVNKIFDRNGNYIEFQYENDPAEGVYRVSNILYGLNSNSTTTTTNKISFTYTTPRPDSTNSWVGGSIITNNRVLGRIDIFSDNALLNTYRFLYGIQTDKPTRLEGILQVLPSENELPPIKINWGKEDKGHSTVGDQYSPVNLTYSNADYDYILGDFNGDGATDIVNLEGVVNNAAFYVNLSDKNGGFDHISSGSANYQTNNPPNTNLGKRTSFHKKNLFFDYNGDGFDDMVQIVVETQGPTPSINLVLYLSDGTNLVYHSLIFTHSDSAAGWVNYCHLIPGDFDGDGKRDILVSVPTGFTSSSPKKATGYDLFLIGDRYPTLNGIPQTGNMVGSMTDHNASFFSMDYNGDGRTDICRVVDGGQYSFEIYQIGLTYDPEIALSSPTNSLQVLYYSIYPNKENIIYTGDFNGDGNTDMITWGDAPWGWDIHYSKGNGGFHIFSLSESIVDHISSNGPTYSSQGPYPDYLYIAEDFNGDGYCDFLEIGPKSGGSRPFNIFYSNGLNNFRKETGSIPAAFDPFTEEYKTGDFNGDGQIDLFALQDGDVPAIIYFHPREISNLVTSIEHAGKRIEIEYRSLAEATAAYTDGDFYGFKPWQVNGHTQTDYPYCSRQLPIKVVTGISDNISLEKSFYYQTLSIHLTGLGILGFETVKTTDWSASKLIENQFSLFPWWGIQGQYSLTQFLSKTITFPLSYPNDTLSFIRYSYLDEPGDPTGKVRIIRNNAVKETNHATALNQEITLKFGVSGGPGSIFYEFGKPDSTLIEYSVHNGYNNVITEFEYDLNAPFYNKHKPILETKTTVYSSKAPYVRKKGFSYNSFGLVSQIQEDPGQKIKNTLLQYDVYGNVISSETQANIDGFLLTFPRTYRYSMDGRFLLKELAYQIYSGSDSFYNIYEYNNWGKITEHTENQLTTIFEYDEVNRLVKTIYPDDVVTRKEYDWAYNNNSGDNPPNLSDEGQPSNFTDYQVITANAHAAQFYVKTTVDNLSGARYSFIDFYGREIRNAYPAHSGNTIYEDRSFLPSGSLGILTAPYFKGDIPVKTTHIYDSFDRFTLSIPTVGPAYLKTYEASITPAYLKTTTKNLGTSKEKVVFSDPGGTYLIQDEGTEIDYVLNSAGQPDEIIINNNPQLTTQFTYDALGRKLSVTEPNKGTTTFTYNDLDQITSETLPSGLTFGYFYNDLGAIISKSSSAANYTFTYYPSSSAAAGKIKKKTLNTGNLTSIEFEYDAVGRLSKSTESVDATHTFETEYSYNNFGQIATRKYPSNILIQYNYNSNGFLSGMETSAQKLWEISNMNHLGQITQAFYFDNANQNGYSSWRSYDELGLPTERIMYSLAGPVHTTISWNQYSFDQNSGNLLWRENKLNNLREEFTYDPLYRLTNVSSNTSVPAMQLSYGLEGNILKKSDVTSSSYDWRYEDYGLKTVPDDLGGVTELSGVHQLNTQVVDYFPHNNRVKELKEAGNEVHFTYGPDQQRVKMELNPGLPGEKIRYYANDYEETTENGITTKLMYIRAAGELIAIIKESQSVSSIYYVESDYLGSITHILDAQGGVNNGIVEERSFDSWGRPRNPLNWQYYPPSVHSPDWLTDRGFTGHEHIWVNGYDYNVVNMNGRLYDPLTGRMFSPDPYVADKTNSQDYNKYTYARNNPLTYVDPSGNIPILVPIIIGAVIGTYIGGSVANNNYNPARWNWRSGKTWGYMAGGAIVGAASGYIGGAVAASGMPMASTAGVASASFVNSVGTAIYTGGQTDVSISLGVASYNFSQSEWGYIGKRGNSALENIGYGFGALANIGDFATLFNGGGQNIRVNSASTKGENEWWGHSSITDENGSSLVSVGPDGRVQKAASLSETWRNSIKDADVNWSTYLGKKGTWSIEINNVSATAISKYASNVSRWDLLLNSCVGHTSRALWTAGLPNVYAFHPHMLNLQLALRQIGIYSSPYLYNIR